MFGSVSACSISVPYSRARGEMPYPGFSKVKVSSLISALL